MIGGEWPKFDISTESEFALKRSSIERWNRGSFRGFELMEIDDQHQRLLVRNKAGIAVREANEIVVFGGGHSSLILVDAMTGRVKELEEPTGALTSWRGGVCGVGGEGEIYFCYSGGSASRAAQFGSLEVKEGWKADVNIYEEGL